MPTPLDPPVPLEATARFYRNLVELMTLGWRADAIDMVYDTLDKLLLAKDFDGVADILNLAPGYCANPALPLSLFLSMLTVTRPFGETLNGRGRQQVLEAVRARVTEGMSPADAALILVGLT